MTNPYPSETRARKESVGELVSDITGDVSTLVRQEIALAKAEVKAEAKQAGKGAGMLAGAGLEGIMVLVFASLTLMFALDLAMPLWTAALIVTVIHGLLAAVLGLQGKASLAKVDPVPHQTVETIKELP